MAAVFLVNVIITPVDGILTEITNDAIHLLDPNVSIDLTANLYFSIVCSIVLAIVCVVVTERVVEPRLGPYHGERAGPGRCRHLVRRGQGPALGVLGVSRGHRGRSRC